MDPETLLYFVEAILQDADSEEEASDAVQEFLAGLAEGDGRLEGTHV